MPRSYSSEMLTSDSYYAANSAVTRPANGEYTVRDYMDGYDGEFWTLY